MSEIKPLSFSLLKQLAETIYKHNSTKVDPSIGWHYWGETRPDPEAVDLDILMFLISAAQNEKNERDRARVKSHEEFQKHLTAGWEFSETFLFFVGNSFEDNIAEAFIRCLEDWGFRMDAYPFFTSEAELRTLQSEYDQAIRASMDGSVYFKKIIPNFTKTIHNVIVASEFRTQLDVCNVINTICVFCYVHGIDLRYFLELRMKHMGIEWPQENK